MVLTLNPVKKVNDYLKPTAYDGKHIKCLKRWILDWSSNVNMYTRMQVNLIDRIRFTHITDLKTYKCLFKEMFKKTQIKIYSRHKKEDIWS